MSHWEVHSVELVHSQRKFKSKKNTFLGVKLSQHKTVCYVMKPFFNEGWKCIDIFLRSLSFFPFRHGKMLKHSCHKTILKKSCFANRRKWMFSSYAQEIVLKIECLKVTSKVQPIVNFSVQSWSLQCSNNLHFFLF